MLVCLAATAVFGGCATKSPDVFIPASEYPAAFAAARDVLHNYRFTMDRVDARAGVLTTRASSSSGFFTPWNDQETSLSQEWEDTINHQQRRVEISFVPEVAKAAGDGQIRPDQAREHPGDLLEAPRDTTARVLVIVERIYQFGWRPNTKSTYLASLTEDTKADGPSRIEVQISDDPSLAGNIAEDIRRLMAKRQKEQPEAAPSVSNASP